MSPKPVKKLVSLRHLGMGLAGHYRWEKEVLVDYIATRLGYLSETITDAAKSGLRSEDHYMEMLAIAKALRKHPSAGMGSKVELAGVFNDLRDFVEWTKEELADYLVHQIVECDLTSLFNPEERSKHYAEEIYSLAIAIYQAQDLDGCDEADAAAERFRAVQAMRQAHAPSTPAAAQPAPAEAKTSRAARARATA